MAIDSFVSCLTEVQRQEIDQAIQRWKWLRSSDLSDDELRQMSGYGIAAKIVETTATSVRVRIEKNPIIIPADRSQKYIVSGKLTHRDLMESPYAQHKAFGFNDRKDMYVVFASSGCAIILHDTYGNNACLARYRSDPNISYSGKWNLPIGAARFCEGDRFSEHFGKTSTAKGRNFDFAIVDPYNKLVLPSQFANTIKTSEMETHMQEVTAKIAQSLSINRLARVPKQVSIVKSEFLNLSREKNIIIEYGDDDCIETYTRRGIDVIGENRQDYNIIRTLKYHVPFNLRNLSYYDLQEDAKTGRVFDNPIGLFRLDASDKPMLSLAKKSPRLISVSQSGRVIDIDADEMPLSREVVPSLKTVLQN